MLGRLCDNEEAVCEFFVPDLEPHLLAICQTVKSGNHGLQLCQNLVVYIESYAPGSARILSRCVNARFFVLASAPLRCSPAYLFTISSAEIPFGVGASWENYILPESRRQVHLLCVAVDRIFGSSLNTLIIVANDFPA